MNLSQSPLLPPPSPWFVPYPRVYLLPEVEEGSYPYKVLVFLKKGRGRKEKGILFREIWKAIGGENTLGGALTRLRTKGYVASDGQTNKARYWITETGICAI